MCLPCCLLCQTTKGWKSMCPMLHRNHCCHHVPTYLTAQLLEQHDKYRSRKTTSVMKHKPQRSLPSRQHCSLLCGCDLSSLYAPKVETPQPSNRRKCRRFMPLVTATRALWSCTHTNTSFQSAVSPPLLGPHSASHRPFQASDPQLHANPNPP